MKTALAAVVVPCYNEAERLNSWAFREFLAGPVAVDLILVNDGSTDDTITLLRAIADEFPGRVEVIDEQPSMGKPKRFASGSWRRLSALPSSASGTQTSRRPSP